MHRWRRDRIGIRSVGQSVRQHPLGIERVWCSAERPAGRRCEIAEAEARRGGEFVCPGCPTRRLRRGQGASPGPRPAAHVAQPRAGRTCACSQLVHSRWHRSAGPTARYPCRRKASAQAARAAFPRVVPIRSTRSRATQRAGAVDPGTRTVRPGLAAIAIPPARHRVARAHGRQTSLGGTLSR